MGLASLAQNKGGGKGEHAVPSSLRSPKIREGVRGNRRFPLYFQIHHIT